MLAVLAPPSDSWQGAVVAVAFVHNAPSSSILGPASVLAQVTVSWDLQLSGNHSSDTVALYVAPALTSFNTSYNLKYKKAGTPSGTARYAGQAASGG